MRKYLPDVNVLIALVSKEHVHHQLVNSWFDAADGEWFLCALTEGGFLRGVTASSPWRITMSEASRLLLQLSQDAGCRYLAIDQSWQTLCGPFASRIYGTKQVTDAYLLGLALRNDLVLVTMDKGISHLAGFEYGPHVLLLEEDAGQGLR